MKKDYYKILNVPEDASSLDIKKAYFSLVRKYSPERYPEEFKDIREAYEVLIDEKTRKEYDSVNSMPDVVKLYFNKSKEALEDGDAEMAIELLERVNKIYPDLTVVKSLLGDAYAENENYGKAIQIFEDLVSEEPENASYAGKLAHAYLSRGWHRKAVNKYKKALELDEDNIALWLGLIECYTTADEYDKARKIIMEALEVGRRKDWDNPFFYLYLLQLDVIERKPDELKKHLEEIKEFVVRNEEHRENIAWILNIISSILNTKEYLEESLAFINTAHELDPGNKKIEKRLVDMEKESALRLQLEKLREDKSIQNIFSDMFEFEIERCGNEDCLDCEFNAFTFEMDILTDIDRYKSNILKIKKEYPELYKLKEKFFYDVLNPARFRSMLYKYRKRLERYIRIMPGRFRRGSNYDDENYEDEEYDREDYDYLDDDDYDEEFNDDEIEYIQQPYRRPEPKVGRNDPCPCGSGKKYKKCCGKDV